MINYVNKLFIVPFIGVFSELCPKYLIETFMGGNYKDVYLKRQQKSTNIHTLFTLEGLAKVKHEIKNKYSISSNSTAAQRDTFKRNLCVNAVYLYGQ